MDHKLKRLVYIAVFSALAMILTLFRAPLPFLPSFYKLDFSESIVLVGGFYLGPVATIAMQLLKNLLKILFSSTNSAFVGDLANFIMGVSFCLPAVWYYHTHRSNKGLLIGLLLGIICLTVTGTLVNYFIVIPMYAAVYNMPVEAIVSAGAKLNPHVNSLFSYVLLFTAPFNLIKGAASALIGWLVYRNSKALLKNELD